MMRFVGNHFIEISTGMEEGKKRRENCKSRAISRRFFSRTDHAKGKGLLEERGNWKEGELRKFNFHMEIWFCRYTQVVLSKKEEKGTTAIYCPKNSSKLHFHSVCVYNSLHTGSQHLFSFIHKCRAPILFPFCRHSRRHFVLSEANGARVCEASSLMYLLTFI